MKKTSIAILSAIVAFGATAQVSVVKEADRAMKSGKPLSEVVTIITPAFTNPETATNAETYFIPGKAGFKQYDDLLGKKQLGTISDQNLNAMPRILLDSYGYMMQALPLDTVVDAKGKVKTKHSKEIVNTVAGHYNDFYGAGLDLWNLGDFAGSYDAWGVYALLPENPTFQRALAETAAPDSTRAEILYNMALAAYQSGDHQKSLDAFVNSLNHGYDRKELIDFGIAVATELQNQDIINMFSRKGMELFGDEDPNYIGYIINGYINSEDYASASSMINEAIAQSPDNSQYYVIKGILCEQDGVDGDPAEAYKTAYEKDPYNKQAAYNYGRMFYNKALEIYNAAPDAPAEFHRVFNEEFKPQMNKAVELFEQAYNLDNEYHDPLKLLEQAYYLLNDESNLELTRQRLTY